MNSQYFSQIPEIDSKLINEMNQYDPKEYLINNSTPTDISQVYLVNEASIKPEKPFIFVIAGPSGAGKDAAIKSALNLGKVKLIVSATSRDRREGEDENSYIWMRKQKLDEDLNLYHENLIQEYDLIEHNVHHNNLYGLPRKSLESLSSQTAGLVHSENNGVRTLREKISGSYNLIVVFVVTESYEVLWERMQNRDNKLIRFRRSVDEIKDAKNIANYYIFNNGSLEDLQKAFNNLLSLITRDSI